MIGQYLEQIHTGARRRQAIFIASRVADAKLGDETIKATVKIGKTHIRLLGQVISLSS